MALNNNVGNALKGLDDFEQVSLGPNQDKSDLQEIDVSSGNNPTARPDASQALTNPQGPQGGGAEVTPGQRVQGTTPQGVSEVAEIEETGKDLGKVGKALSNPAVQKFLGEMGVAFGRGNPNEPGVMLGKSGIDQAKAQQTNNLAAKMLKGEEITEEDMQGVDSETLGQAREQSLAQREQQRKEEATEADIEQGEDQLDIQQQKVDIEERFNDLRERGMELDEEKFQFNKDMSEKEVLQAEQELAIAERKQRSENRLAASQAQYYKARADALGKEGEPTPQEQARLNEAKNETRQIISEQIQIEQDRLQQMESQVSSDNPNWGDFAKAFFQVSDTQRSAQLERELENNVPQGRQAVKQQRQFVNNLQEQLNNLQTEGGGQTGGDQSEDGDAVTVETEEDLQGLSPGTTVQNPNGVQGVVQEDGTIEW